MALQPVTRHFRRWPTVLAAVAGWVFAVGAGLALLIWNDTRPGPLGAVPRHWPRGTPLPRASAGATLVMFAHPRCPCTRASLNELAVILARCHGRLTAHVVFVRPAESPSWEQSTIVRDAAAMTGVNVTWDRGGEIAAAFGAKTSGHVAIYDSQGLLRVSGGITPLRGHVGDNAGRRAIIQIVTASGGHDPGIATLRPSPDLVQTPVFGCPLVNEPPSGEGGVVR